MVPLTSLWLPILLAAVIVFVASSVIHMVLGYHSTDFSRLPQQNSVMDALRPLNIPPGEYFAPHSANAAERKSPEFTELAKRGPVFALTVFPAGQWQMGGRLFQWFLYSVAVSLVAAYIAGRTLPPGTDYLQVFRVSGTVAFAGYALGHLPPSIWYNRKWSTTLKNVFDGLIYGLLTGGTFGWLWPAM